MKSENRTLPQPNNWVTKIKTNNQETTNSEIQTKKTNKMPIFKCSCGANILTVPDLPEMNKAIKTHIIEHKKITGQQLKDEIIAQAILKTIVENQR